MNKQYSIANTIEMNKRTSLAKDFYMAILDPEETPFIVTDEATLYDIYLGDEEELIKKVNKKYQIFIDLSYFEIPFWQFLDFINKNKSKDI